MEKVKYKGIIERMIKGRTRYEASKRSGKDIRKYIGKDIRVSTLLEISQAMGFHLIVTNGKEVYEIDR